MIFLKFLEKIGKPFAMQLLLRYSYTSCGKFNSEGHMKKTDTVTAPPSTAGAPVRYRFLLWSVPFFLAGVLLQLMPVFGWNFSTLPGSLDTLFNRYVLEHGYLWLMGEEPSFWNAPFFYPAPLALAYSDCHAGNLPFYALFRIAGFAPDGALQCWILLQYLLNFAAGVWMLRKLEFSPLAAAAGGYLFTFAMPVTAQLTHIQLLPRFPIPLAFGALWLFWKKPDLRCFTLLIGALFWQFACSIYLGTLLLLALAVLFCCLAIRDWKRKDWRQVLLGDGHEILYRVLLLVAAAAILQLYLFPPYLVVWRMLNLTQPFSIQLLLLPRLSSYLLPAGDAVCWQWLHNQIPIDAYKDEHALFTGIAALTTTLAAAWALCRKRERHPLLLSAFLCWLILIVFSLQIGDFCLYKTLRGIVPGLNSLRSMTRIILVLLLFQAIFVAWAVDRLKDGKFKRWLFLFLPVLILEGMVLHPQYCYDKKQEQAKVDRIAAQLKELPPRSVFIRFADPPEPGPETNLYAMLAAQQTGMITVNGYSGHNPPGWFLLGWPEEKDRQSALRQWQKLSGEVFFQQDPAAPWKIRLYRIH